MSSPQLSVGASGVVHGPVGLAVRFEVLAVDAVDRIWSWRVRLGPIRATMAHEVLARPGGGSVATLQIDGPPGLAPAYAPAAQLALSRLVRAPDAGH